MWKLNIDAITRGLGSKLTNRMWHKEETGGGDSAVRIALKLPYLIQSTVINRLFKSSMAFASVSALPCFAVWHLHPSQPVKQQQLDWNSYLSWWFQRSKGLIYLGGTEEFKGRNGVFSFRNAGNKINGFNGSIDDLSCAEKKNAENKKSHFLMPEIW
jgi:hypothetical protein